MNLHGVTTRRLMSVLPGRLISNVTHRHIGFSSIHNKQFSKRDGYSATRPVLTLQPLYTLNIAKISSGNVKASSDDAGQSARLGSADSPPLPADSPPLPSGLDSPDANPYLSFVQSELKTATEFTAGEETSAADVLNNHVNVLVKQSGDGAGFGKVLRETLQPYMTRDYFPVDCAAKFVEFCHDFTGLPWWASILLSATIVRTALFPFAVMTLKAQVNLMKHLPELYKELGTLRVKIQQARMRGAFKTDKEAERHFRVNCHEMHRELYVTHKCHPLISVSSVLVQAPTFIFMSFGIRNVMGFIPFDGLMSSGLTNESFMNEGLFWCTNFLLPDTTCILPALNFLFICLNTEIGYLKVPILRGEVKVFFWVLRFVAIWTTILAYLVPSGVAYYWVLSGMFGLIQNLLLMNPTVRQLLKVPRTSRDRTDWDFLKQNAKHRYLGAPPPVQIAQFTKRGGFKG